MPKITNRLNLPAPLVEAVANSSYNKGQSDITATGLIEPPRIGALKAKHAEELVEDASDLIYSLQGQSVHTILERAAGALASDGWICEERFYIDVAGWRVGAQIDVFHTPTGLLQDYKVTSVYSVKDGPKEDYVKQMNIQAECLRQAGHEVKKLEIVAILRDWTKGERDRDRKDAEVKGFTSNYPEHQVTILNVPLLSSSEVLPWIGEQVQRHKEARSGQLPQCSQEDRWARPDKWAVMKKGGSRALKLHDTQESADEHAQNQTYVDVKNKYFVEHRPGSNIRCDSYCPVSKFCEQYKKLKG